MVMLAFACMLSGCGKESPKMQEDSVSSSPESYMKDPQFRQTLSDRRKAAQSLGAERQKIKMRMDEMMKIMGEKLKSTDTVKIVAELEKLGEWRNLQSEAKRLDAEFENHRKETLRIVRERVAPKGEISK